MSVSPSDQIYKQNADTRQECLHQNYSFALLLYHRSQKLSIELGALQETERSHYTVPCRNDPQCFCIVTILPRKSTVAQRLFSAILGGVI